VEPQVTVPFPPDLFEALAQRVAELLAERPPVQRYLDAEQAAAYLGIRSRRCGRRSGVTAKASPTGSSTAAASSSTGSPSTSTSPPRAARPAAATPSAASRPPPRERPGERRDGGRTYSVTVGSRHPRVDGGEQQALLVQRSCA
jgi:hypothetical protein